MISCQLATKILYDLRQTRIASPASHYLLKQLAVQLEFKQQRFKSAVDCTQDLLNWFPHDPWGMKMLAAAVSETYLDHGTELETDQLESIMDLFDQAIQAVPDESDTLELYVYYLSEACDSSNCLKIVDDLKRRYPHQMGTLLFYQSQLLSQAGLSDQAASVFLET